MKKINKLMFGLLVAPFLLIGSNENRKENLNILRYLNGETEQFYSKKMPSYYQRKFGRALRDEYRGPNEEAEFFVNFNSGDVSDSQLATTSRKPLQKETVYKIIEEYTQSHGTIGHGDIMKKVARLESRLNPSAMSKVGAVGLYQIMVKTGKWVSEVYFLEKIETKDLFSIFVNAKLGCKYFSEIYEECGDVHETAGRWNYGSRNYNIRKSSGIAMPEETIKFQNNFKKKKA